MNSVISVPSRKPAELNLGGTATTEKVFQDADGNPVVLPLLSAGQICGANGPARSQVGHVMVRASGRVEGGTTTNFTVQLQYGISATPGNNTDLEASSAIAVNSVKGLWWIEAELWIDNDSGKVSGFGRFGVNGSTNTVQDFTVIDNLLTSVDPDGGASLGFVVTGTFSVGNAGNKAYLDNFSLELLP